MDSPGLFKRLNQALTTNVAETREQHEYAELRTPLYQQDAAELWQHILLAGAELGWQQHAADQQAGTVHWIVTTRLLRFRDDVTLRLEPREDGMQALYIRSASRKGRGDLGANANHIRQLQQQLQLSLQRKLQQAD